MFIHNVRFGLACNSSSSHSLIFFNKDALPEDSHGFTADDSQFEILPEDDEGDIEFKKIMVKSERKRLKRELKEPIKFGWNFFTASSKETKARYTALHLRYMLERELPPNIVDMIIKSWTGVENLTEDDYIDHQSMMVLPYAFGTKIPDEEFFKEFHQYIMNDKLVILGGNDNDEYSHPLSDSGNSANLPLERDGYRSIVCRKDSEYDYWTLFNAEDGTKVRMSFDGKAKVTKASAPELVDIKINDYCPFACKFCYQDSTKDKGHSVISYYSLAKVFKELKVFEVALGGGEPTMHPEFVRILQYFRNDGIVPNFTTKNLKWLRDPNEFNPILESAGCFAFSADNSAQIDELGTLLDYNKIKHERATIQIVMGTLNSWEFDNILKACYENRFKLTLLGFKEVGRGVGFKPQKYDWWLDSIKKKQKTGTPSICIDTALALQYEKEILAAGIPSYMFHTLEGKFSMYYDSMRGLVGPSSYCKETEIVEWNCDEQKSANKLKKIFANF